MGVRRVSLLALVGAAALPGVASASAESVARASSLSGGPYVVAGPVVWQSGSTADRVAPAGVPGRRPVLLGRTTFTSFADDMSGDFRRTRAEGFAASSSCALLSSSSFDGNSKYGQFTTSARVGAFSRASRAPRTLVSCQASV